MPLPSIKKAFNPNIPISVESGLSEIADIPEKYLGALSQFAFGLQLEHFFTVHFDVPGMITDQEMSDLNHYISGITSHKIKDVLTNNQLFHDLGCLFCRGISLPPFGADPRFVSSSYRDFKGTPYASPISVNNVLGVTFYDTHLSFTEFILRPWAILLSHYGLCARDPTGQIDPLGPLINGLRVNLIVTQFSRSGGEILLDTKGGPSLNVSDLKVTKKWVFYKAGPVDLGSGQDYIQSTQNNLILRKVSWIFEDYSISIDSGTNVPISSNSLINVIPSNQPVIPLTDANPPSFSEGFLGGGGQFGGAGAGSTF